MKMNYWTTEQEQFLKDNCSKFNIYELEEQIQRSITSIRKKAYNLGLVWKEFTNDEIRQLHKRYLVNENFFKTWSNDMAYILGLWYADGHITKGGSQKSVYVFSIALHNDDSEILSQIMNKMNSTYKILQHSETVKCFKINSKTIYEDIVALGGCERKSLKLSFPKSIPDEFVPDFIRGYFDGDGCISYHSNMKAFRTTIVCGCKEFLEEFHNKLKILDSTLMGQISFQKNDHTGIYHLTFYKHDTLKFANIIYKNPQSLYLKRKYDGFEKAYKFIMGENKNDEQII